MTITQTCTLPALFPVVTFILPVSPDCITLDAIHDVTGADPALATKADVPSPMVTDEIEVFATAPRADAPTIIRSPTTGVNSAPKLWFVDDTAVEAAAINTIDAPGLPAAGIGIN